MYAIRSYYDSRQEEDMWHSNQAVNIRLFLSQFLKFFNSLDQMAVNRENMVDIVLRQGFNLV